MTCTIITGAREFEVEGATLKLDFTLRDDSGLSQSLRDAVRYMFDSIQSDLVSMSREFQDEEAREAKEHEKQKAKAMDLIRGFGKEWIQDLLHLQGTMPLDGVRISSYQGLQCSLVHGAVLYDLKNGINFPLNDLPEGFLVEQLAKAEPIASPNYYHQAAGIDETKPIPSRMADARKAFGCPTPLRDSCVWSRWPGGWRCENVNCAKLVKDGEPGAEDLAIYWETPWPNKP
jgi:hypothetical protein